MTVQMADSRNSPRPKSGRSILEIAGLQLPSGSPRHYLLTERLARGLEPIARAVKIPVRAVSAARYLRPSQR